MAVSVHWILVGHGDGGKTVVPRQRGRERRGRSGAVAWGRNGGWAVGTGV
jgi:hypothetical protein